MPIFKGRSRRLANMVSLIAILWTLIIVSLVAWWYYDVTRARTLDSMENRLLGIAASAATLIDGDLHRQIVANGTETDPDYLRYVQILRRIKEANGGDIKYIYSFYRDPANPKKVKFGLDIGVGDEHSPLNSEYENPISPCLLEVYRTGRARCEPEAVEDQWGLWRTAHAPIKNAAGKVVATLGVDLAVKPPKFLTPTNIILGVAVIFISIFLGSIFARLLSPAITRPLSRLTDAAARVANGDLQTEVGRKQRHREFQGLADGFHEMLGSLRRVVGELKQGAEMMDEWSNSLKMSAEQSGRGATEIAATMSEMAAGADSVAASAAAIAGDLRRIDELSATVAEETRGGNEAMLSVAADMGQSVMVIEEMVELARKAAGVTNEANEHIHSFQKWTEQISNMVEFIADLSEQINMLSMNAQIEAARAGEHGIGFSVIAQKVGKLADDARNMVEQIYSLNLEMSGRVNELNTHITDTEKDLLKNAEQMLGVRQIFGKIAPKVNATSQLLARIASSTEELRERIVKGREEADTIAVVAEEEAGGIEGASATAQEQAALAEEVEATVAQLRRLAAQLHQEMSNFKV